MTDAPKPVAWIGCESNHGFTYENLMLECIRMTPPMGGFLLNFKLPAAKFGIHTLGIILIDTSCKKQRLFYVILPLLENLKFDHD